MNIDEFSDRVHHAGYDPRRTGNGFRCRCPGHDDTNPSLDVTTAEDGRILMICRSRACKPEDILKPLGLKVSDLFPAPPNKGEPKAVQKEPRLQLSEFARVKKLPESFLVSAGLKDVRDGIFLNYGTGKRCRKRLAWNGADRFLWLKGDEPLRVYTSDVLPPDMRPSTEEAYVVEGESDSLAIWFCGIPAIGIPGSTMAGKLRLEDIADYPALVIWQEPGPAGEKFAKDAARRIKEVGYTKPVRFIHPCRDKDPSELFVRLQANQGEFIHALAALTIKSKDQPLVSTKEASPSSSASVSAVVSTKIPDRRLKTTQMSDYHMKPVQWLVPGFIPQGMLSLLTGHGGAGKSTLLAHLTACLSTGRPAFGINHQVRKPTNVLICNLEDAAEHVLLPRLVAAGADLTRIRLLNGTIDEAGKVRPFSLNDIDLLEVQFAECEFSLLIIDPISGPIANAGGRDNLETDVRPLLEALAQFAEKHGVAVVGVKHLGKGDRENATMRTLGSVAYTAVPRMVISLTRDPENEERRILARCKCNLPVTGDPGVSFGTEKPAEAPEMVSRLAPELSAEESSLLADQLSRCVDFELWNGNIEDLVQGQNRESISRSEDQKSAAASWLRTFLENQPQPSLNCVREGNKATGLNFGQDWWRKILSNLLGGKPVKRGPEWTWALEEEIPKL